MKIQAFPLIVARVCCLSVNSAMAAEAIHPAVIVLHSVTVGEISIPAES
jgi:hypothetical protein